MSDFQQLKLAIIEVLHLSKDALHVHLGLLVFVAVVLLLGGRRSPWLPWLAAAAVALGIEVVDLRDDAATGGHPRYLASLHDIVNTLFWPTLLALLGGRLRLRGSRTHWTNGTA